jgi:hypothetical protein
VVFNDLTTENDCLVVPSRPKCANRGQGGRLAQLQVVSDIIAGTGRPIKGNIPSNVLANPMAPEKKKKKGRQLVRYVASDINFKFDY